MAHKDKQLLLQDLTGRLPYNVIVQVNDGLKGTYDSQLVQVFCDRVSCSVNVRNPLEECVCIDSVKPYLRPLSSMTEEEIIEFNNIPSTKNYTIIENDLPWDVAHYKQITWLNKKMFDYRGLIPNGLALEAPEDMYKT